MNRTITRDVASYWYRGLPACNNGSQHWTDGNKIYSYQLCIGETLEDGRKMVHDYTANTQYGFRSMTTSKHVGYVRAGADVINDGLEIKEKYSV